MRCNTDTKPARYSGSFKPSPGLRHRHVQTLLSRMPLHAPVTRGRIKALLDASHEEIVECGDGVRLMGLMSARSPAPRGLVIIAARLGRLCRLDLHAVRGRDAARSRLRCLPSQLQGSRGYARPERGSLPFVPNRRSGQCRQGHSGPSPCPAHRPRRLLARRQLRPAGGRARGRRRHRPRPRRRRVPGAQAQEHHAGAGDGPLGLSALLSQALAALARRQVPLFPQDATTSATCAGSARSRPRPSIWSRAIRAFPTSIPTWKATRSPAAPSKGSTYPPGSSPPRTTR